MSEADNVSEAGKERIRREDPERSEPIRSWSARRSASRRAAARPADGGDTAASANPEATSSWADTVAGGVNLGYRVIEEQIRLGQRVAAQVNDRIYGSAGREGGLDDLSRLTERAFRAWWDMTSAWLDFVATPTTGRRAAAPPEAEADHRQAAGEEQPREPAVSFDVDSPRRTEVTLDLRPRSAERALATRGLAAADAEIPPLRDISFESDAGENTLRVGIVVPRDQPPELYTGVVLDQETGEARGTLSVRLAR